LKKNLIFGSLAVAAIAYFVYSKKQFGEKTKLLFDKIKIVGSGISRKIELNFKVQNPTGSSGTISALQGEVYFAGKQVADFSNFSEQRIAPKSESVLKVIASPSIGILQLLATKGWLKKGAVYEIKGTANFDGIVAPFGYKAAI
jgi:LEA14-like dessication related protein